MTRLKRCEVCRTPAIIASLQRWLNNGDLVQAANPNARAALVECENIDPIFRDIGRAIGVSIDHIVINIVARGHQLFMESVIPEPVKEMIRNKTIDVQAFTQGTFDLVHVLGYGKHEFLGYRYENDENDFCRIRITRPFSILEAAGGFAGVIAAAVGGEHSVTYRETAPGVFELTSGWTTYPEVLKERLQIVPYEHQESDLELEKCAACGVPVLLSKTCSWDFDNGVITNRGTGYRMALLGPGLMDSLFEALEWELGDEVPRLVVDAQRRFTREGFAPIDLSLPTEELRAQFALRGLGNLRELKVGRREAFLRLENSCMRLLLVGLLQGTFERAHGVDSSVDWETDEKGTLQVEVKGLH